MPLCNTLVATAKSTQALAEWQVNVEANALAGIALRKCPVDRCFPFVHVDGLVIPVGNGWIAGITRAGDIVFLNQVTLHHGIQQSDVTFGLTA